jgi:peptidoglycan/xylan/chitin deacetylase (PgdA/CDA1 family)
MRISQSWDDGVVDDIRLVALLRQYCATATFNLNPILYRSQRTFSWSNGNKAVWRLGRDELVDVYSGFEIANHSMSHPNLLNLSKKELAYEVLDSRLLLQDWFQQPIRGFCYPFDGYNPTVKEVVRAAGHVYARTIIECESILPPTDPYEFKVSCRFNDPAFWALYQRAKSSDGVFCFWGHSYELANEAMWVALEEKISSISSDPAADWTNIETLFDFRMKSPRVNNYYPVS